MSWHSPDVAGRLLCAATSIDADGQRSIQADRLRVAGTVRFPDHFTAYGEVRRLGARIDGSVDFSGAHVSSGEGPAVGLGGAVIGGSVFLVADLAGRRPVIRGRIDMAVSHRRNQCHGHADAVSGEMSQNPAS